MAQGSRHPTRADETVPQGGDTVGYVQSEVCWNLRPDPEGWDDWTTFNTEDVESAYKTDHERGDIDAIFEPCLSGCFPSSRITTRMNPNVGEKPLELWKGVRERQIVTLMYVH
jgi:hypothetical protein